MKTNKQAQHTALPWRVRDQGGKDYRFIIESEADEQTQGSYSGRPIAFIPEGLIANEANATFIITAVNAHDDLIAAAKRMMAALRNARDTRPEEWDALVTPDICSAWTETMSALALAGKVGE